MESNTTLRDEVKELKELIESGSNKKLKPFNLPRKARLSKKNIKDGYVSIILVNENKGIDFTKKQIIDGTIKIDKTFHTLKADDVFTYKNKPIIIQAKNKLNPHNPLDGKNETYGHQYIMARMEGDKIVSKKGIGMGMGIGALILIGIILYAIFAG